MQSRTIREGSLGLLIIAGVAVLGGGVLWLRGFRGDSGFSFAIAFTDASGLSVGSPVRFRGVQIGKVQNLQAESTNVKVNVAIDNPKLVIPRDSLVETNQSGFLNSTTIDIFPKANLASDPNFDPLSQNCDNNKIVCRGITIEGKTGVNFTQVVRETSETMRKLNDSELLNSLNKTLKSTDEAAQSFKVLANSANKLINSFQGPVAQFSDTATAISQAANNFSQTANKVDGLILENKEKLAKTLEGISATANEAKALLASTRPLLDDGKFIKDLQKLSDNAAETAANLRQLSTEVNNPNTIATMRETLDSARATFANTQKITADLDELTGDPKFRSNVRNLVNGLSGLLSSTPSLTAPVASSPKPEIELETALLAKAKSPIPAKVKSPEAKLKDKPKHKPKDKPSEQPQSKPATELDKFKEEEPLRVKSFAKPDRHQTDEIKINNATPNTTQTPVEH
jgi:phospholipid/cholesterol/gamma-HCH transport system substrate-binding protein